MRKKGSITVFFSLLLVVFLLLFQVMLRSVQIAGGKVQAEAGVLEGLYSVFAGYDRQLFDSYHVFFLDGGYGTGTFMPDQMYQEVKAGLANSCSSNAVVTGICGDNNLWNCSEGSGAITAYTLASDQQGQAFKIQAVDYMKATAGIQGIQLLLQQGSEQVERLQTQKGSVLTEEGEAAQAFYEEERANAEAGKAENIGQIEESSSDSTVNQELVEVPADFVNPLDVILKLKMSGILSLVLPAETELSDKTLPGDSYSKRNLRSGMGTLYYGENPRTVTGNLLFEAYEMTHLGHYGKEAEHGMAYQLEYVIAGKTSDEENLRSVVKQLMVIRQASNMVYLQTNAEAQAKLHEMSLMICSLLGFSPLEGVVSLALEAAWAFGESVLDLRQLLLGGKIPIVKSADTWLLSIENLAKLPELLSDNQVRSDKGLDYGEYLALLLTKAKSETQVIRTMDMVETAMRDMENHENFCMDLCVSYLQVEMDFVCVNREFQVVRDYGYEM